MTTTDLDYGFTAQDAEELMESFDKAMNPKSHDNSGRDATQEDVEYFHDLEIKF